MIVDTNSMTTNKMAALGAFLRPENHLAFLFAFSTTLWTVAFLAYYLSTRAASGLAVVTRAAHVRGKMATQMRYKSARLATLVADGSSTPRPTLPV